MIKTIDKFDGEFAFLSNFYPSPISRDGKTFPTVEHAFQAMKTFDSNEREAIRTAPTPGKAKRLGKKCKLRSNWESIKIQVMRMFLEDKFADGHLREQLLATGDAELIEGNTWGDQFWGVCDGKGENHLGKLLMKIREETKSHDLA